MFDEMTMTSRTGAAGEGVPEKYFEMRLRILTASDLRAEVLEAASVELEVDVELFVADSLIPYRTNYEALNAMIACGFNAVDDYPDSSLNGLTPYQLHFVWSYVENELGLYFRSGRARLNGWSDGDAAQVAASAEDAAARAFDRGLMLMIGSLDPQRAH